MRLSRLLLTTVLLAAPLAAHASTLLVTLSGTENGSFLMSSTPPISPDTFYGGDAFFVVPISPLPPTLASLEFYDSSLGGGYSDSLDGTGYAGTQLFGGTDAAPTFAPGQTLLFLYSDPNAIIVETVTITATPEPSSLVLLGTGVLGMAGAVRRRLRK